MGKMPEVLVSVCLRIGGAYDYKRSKYQPVVSKDNQLKLGRIFIQKVSYV